MIMSVSYTHLESAERSRTSCWHQTPCTRTYAAPLLCHTLAGTALREMMAKKPEKVMELAVKGMLPKGPLGRSMMDKLHVYAGPDHEQAAQKPEVLTF